MTKVAIISRSSPDYSIDIVADGLIRILGRENVFIQFDKNHMANDIRYTHLMNGFFDKPNSFPLYDADFLLVSTRSKTPPIQDWLARTGGKKLATIDGEDHHLIDQAMLAASKIYFKREYLPDQTYAGNIKPFPFAAIPEEPKDRLPIERVVFFMGHHNQHPVRIRFATRMAQIGFPPHTAYWPKQEYNRALRASLIGISMQGWGWDTYRYWEIPYFGVCLLSQRIPIVIPGNFKEDEEALFYSDENELQTKLQALLAEPERAIKIAAAGQKACWERHLSIHRAKTVLEAMA